MKATTRLAPVVLLACRTGAGAADAYVAPEARPVPSAARVDTLIAGFHRLRGTVSDGGIHYALLVDHRPLAEVASADTTAIPRLVACLSDVRPSRVTRGRQRLPVGGLCAYVLSETPYARERLQHARFPRDWAGSVAPWASGAELRAARAAWETWIHAGKLASPR